MIGLALSGGGARAMAFHLGCLRTLHDFGLLEETNVLSCVSGGSVIGALYAYTPELSFNEFEARTLAYLQTGFQGAILRDLLKPTNLIPTVVNSAITKSQAALAKLGLSDQAVHRDSSRTDIFSKILDRDLFSGATMTSPRRHNLDVVIGACDLRTGSAFRFGNKESGCGRFGKLLEEEIDVGFAVAASAAFPLLLPPLDRTWTFLKGDVESRHRVALTDGGVYDNSGFQVLEPGRDPRFSLHSFPCDYIIACNAGHGQDPGRSLPLGFLSRTQKSFNVVHKRVQDLLIHQIHHLRESGKLKGFALPYLGQQDSALPWITSDHVARDEVVGYPTNFSPMTDEWIDKLSKRGESLTRVLVTTYLRELVG